MNDPKFRLYAGRIMDLVPRHREIECLALLAKMLSAYGVNITESTSKHPNSKRSRNKEFTPEELAEIEKRKAEIQAGWTPADFENRKNGITGE